MSYSSSSPLSTTLPIVITFPSSNPLNTPLQGLSSTASTTSTLTSSGTNYTEKASPTLIALGATIVDAPLSLNGSTLTVRVSAGAASGDRLSLLTDTSLTLDGRII